VGDGQQRKALDFLYTIEETTTALGDFSEKHQITGCVPLRDIFTICEKKHDFSDLIPQNIGTSINLHQVTKCGFSPINCHWQPMIYALYIQKENAHILVALNKEDAKGLLFNKIDRAHLIPGSSTALINIHSGTVISCQTDQPLPANLDADFSVLISRTVLKIFSGDLSLSQEERLALMHHCATLGPRGFEKMMQFVQSYVCLLHPQRAEAKEAILSFLEDRGATFLAAHLVYLREHARANTHLQQKVERLQKAIEKDLEGRDMSNFIRSAIDLFHEIHLNALLKRS
jgi:hypothetical protein